MINRALSVVRYKGKRATKSQAAHKPIALVTRVTIKIDRRGFGVHREHVKGENPVVSGRSVEDGTIAHVQNFFACVRDRKEPSAPVEAGVAAARAGHLANLALRRGEKVTWPLKPTPPS